MATMNEVLRVDYDARLVEEAVMRSLHGKPEEEPFREERDCLYEVEDPDGRELLFRKLHASWFLRLGLDRPIQEALDELPRLKTAVGRCAVTLAVSKKDEGADLFVAPAGDGRDEIARRSVGIQVRPESLLEPDRLLGFLRHELLHVDDMLNPDFGYEPFLPRCEIGPTHDRLLQDRYRTLWDATIDGRLLKAGLASDTVRERRLLDFARAFPMFGERTPEAFGRFFEDAAHTHAGLVTFAQDAEGFPGPDETGQQGSRCPVCRFPTYDFEQAPERLPADVIARVREDFPDWHPSRGICSQCVELYRTRPLSLSEMAHLPGIPYR